MIDYVVTGQLEENCYIVFNDEHEDCILIDPGSDADDIEEMCAKYKKIAKYILLTHGHFDHIGACKHFQDKYGAKVYVHEEDQDKLVYDRAAVMWGFTVEWTKADELLHDGDVLDMLGYKIRVVHTPGHSKGSCIYIFDSEKSIFSGDTIFFRSYGRTDFLDGSPVKMRETFKKIYAIEGIDDYTVYTGHGISTTIAYEKKYNTINREL